MRVKSTTPCATCGHPIYKHYSILETGPESVPCREDDCDCKGAMIPSEFLLSPKEEAAQEAKWQALLKLANKETEQLYYTECAKVIHLFDSDIFDLIASRAEVHKLICTKRDSNRQIGDRVNCCTTCLYLSKLLFNIDKQLCGMHGVKSNYRSL